MLRHLSNIEEKLHQFKLHHRWILCFFILTVFGLIFYATKMSNKVLAIKNENRIFKVGIYDNKPKVYRDKNGSAAGLFPDILDYISKQENWQLKYVFGTWEEGLTRLEKKEINLMVDVAISEERQKRFDFTNETVLSSWGVIIVHKNSVIDSFKDLDGKKIAILKSSIYYGGSEGVNQYIQSFGLKINFINVDEYSKIYDLLDKGKVDAAIVSRVSALINQKNYPDIKETDMFFNPTELRFALTKGDTDNQYLIDKLDYWVKKLKNGHGNVYRQLLERNDLTGIITSKEIIPSWLIFIIFLGAIILLFLSFFIVRLIRKRAIYVQKLKESEDKFHSLYKSMSEMVILYEIVKDKNGKIIDCRIVDCNPTFSKIMGIPHEKAIGTLASKLYGPSKTPCLSIYIDVAETGHPHHFETFFKKLNKYFDVSIFSPSHGRLCTIANDITDRKKAEKEIKARTKELEIINKSQEETKKAMLNVMEDLEQAKTLIEIEKVKDEAILTNIGEGLIAVDNNRKILVLNKAAENILGWKIEDMVGKDITFLLLEDEQGHSITLDKRPTKIALSTGKTTNSFYFFVRKDKTRFPIAINATPIKLNEKIIGAVIIFRDITHEKEIDRAKSEFVSLASHQLRTPLGIMKWYLEALKDEKYFSKAPRIIHDYFFQIYRNNERILDLVRSLLSISRIEQGRIKNSPKLVDIVLEIKKTVEQMQIIAHKKKLSLNLTIYGQKIPFINIDDLRFHEVLENLISNAIEYTMALGSINVIVNKINDLLLISVKDTGIGISPADQKKLYIKFFRSETAIKHNPEGSGLGLYVVKSYVEGWGGKITVESIEGKGSTFTISLPISQKKYTKGGESR